MKKIMLVACMALIGAGAFAQDMAAESAKGEKATKKKVTYYCPKCFSSAKGPSQCPACKLDRIGEGAYYCPHCYILCPKVRCPNCYKDGVKMTAH